MALMTLFDSVHPDEIWGKDLPRMGCFQELAWITVPEHAQTSVVYPGFSKLAESFGCMMWLGHAFAICENSNACHALFSSIREHETPFLGRFTRSEVITVQQPDMAVGGGLAPVTKLSRPRYLELSFAYL